MNSIVKGALQFGGLVIGGFIAGVVAKKVQSKEERQYVGEKVGLSCDDIPMVGIHKSIKGKDLEDECKFIAQYYKTSDDLRTYSIYVVDDDPAFDRVVDAYCEEKRIPITNSFRKKKK